MPEVTVLRAHARSHDVVLWQATDEAYRLVVRAGQLEQRPVWDRPSRSWFVISSDVAALSRACRDVGVVLVDERPDDPTGDRPPWCGDCDPRTRHVTGVQRMLRCPNCHPLADESLPGRGEDQRLEDAQVALFADTVRDAIPTHYRHPRKGHR